MPVKDLSPNNLEQARKRAVQLRLSGYTLAETSAQTGLSIPTITKVFKAFEQGGWAAIKLAVRGRKAGEGSGLTAEQQGELREHLLQAPKTGLWSREAVVAEVDRLFGVRISERALARLLESWGLYCASLKVKKPKGVRNPAARWYRHQYEPLLSWAQACDATLLLAHCHPAGRTPDTFQLSLQTPLRKQLWLETTHWPSENWLVDAFQRTLDQLGSPLAVCLSGLDLSRAHNFQGWLAQHDTLLHLIAVPPSVEL